MLRDGIGYFTHAVAAIFRPSATILKLVAIAVSVASAIYVLVTIYGGADLLLSLADMLALALIAIPWNRHLYFGVDGPKTGAVRGGGWLYVVDWIVIGIIVAMVVMLPFLILFLVQVLFDRPVPEMWFASDLYSFIDMENFTLDADLWVSMLLAFLIFWFAAYLTLRISMTLPNLAVTGSRVRLRDSWTMTRPVAGALVVTAALTVLGIAFWSFGMVMLADVLYVAYDEGRIPLLLHDVLQSVVSVLMWVVQLMVGAGTLTLIYKQVRAPLDQA